MSDSFRGSSGGSSGGSSRELGMKLELQNVPIFGRDDEFETLSELLNECQTQATIAIVHGKAGSGKSSLIQSYRQTWAKAYNHLHDSKDDIDNNTLGFLFGSGKFDLSTSSQPFSAPSQAMNALVDAYFDSIGKEQVALALRDFAPKFDLDYGVLLNEYPRIANFLKNQQNDDVATVPHKPLSQQKIKNQTANRFLDSTNTCLGCIRRASAHLLGNLCKQANPLRRIVIFIDDLQWADTVSLEFLNTVSKTPESYKGLLVVAAFREEDVDLQGVHHPVVQVLNDFETNKWRVSRLHVTNLNEHHINAFVSNVTKRTLDDTLPLSQVIHRKAGGNPFYVDQFLQLLQRESFLYYSFQTYRWEWADVHFIERSMNVSDDVADVVASAMKHLEERTLRVLMVASCLGAAIPIKILEDYFGACLQQCHTTTQYVEDGKEAKTDGTPIVKPNEVRGILGGAVAANILGCPQSCKPYFWLHDRLQEAAYAMVSPDVRQIIHRQLGQLMLRRVTDDDNKGENEDEVLVYMAADQFNRYCTCYHVETKDFPGSVEVAELNYQAAMLSISKSAFVPAVDLLHAASTHLTASNMRWNGKYYNLTLDVLNALAKAELRVGNSAEAIKISNEIIDRAKTVEDKFYVQNTLVGCYSAMRTNGSHIQAATILLTVLSEYNVRLPLKPTYFQIWLEQRRLRSAMSSSGEKIMSFSRLLELPTMQDNTALKITSLIGSHLASECLVDPSITRLVWLANMYVLRMCTRYGVANSSARALMGLALISLRLGRTKEAFDRIDIARRLCERFPEDPLSHAYVTTIAYSVIYPVKRPFHESLEPLLETSQAGIRNGEFLLSSLAASDYCGIYLCVGLPLSPLEKDLALFSIDARRFVDSPLLLCYFHLMLQLTLNLQGKSPCLTDIQDQEAMIKLVDDQNVQLHVRHHYYLKRLMLACIFRRWDDAAAFYEEMNSAEREVFGLPFVMYIRDTFQGLAAFGLARKLGCRKWRRRGEKIIKRLKTQLARGDVNAHAVLFMLKAECDPSKERYDEAIRICSRSGLTHYDAYMNESAGLFFMNDGKSQDMGWAEYYLRNAMERYGLWGATKKVSLLKEEYEFLRSSNKQMPVGSSLKGRSRYSVSFRGAVSRVTRFSMTDVAN